MMSNKSFYELVLCCPTIWVLELKIFIFSNFKSTLSSRVTSNKEQTSKIIHEYLCCEVYICKFSQIQAELRGPELRRELSYYTLY